MKGRREEGKRTRPSLIRMRSLCCLYKCRNGLYTVWIEIRDGQGNGRTNQATTTAGELNEMVKVKVWGTSDNYRGG